LVSGFRFLATESPSYLVTCFSLTRSFLKLPKAHRPSRPMRRRSLHREISYRSASVPPQYRRDFFLLFFLIGPVEDAEGGSDHPDMPPIFLPYGMRQKVRPLAQFRTAFAVDPLRRSRAATTAGVAVTRVRNFTNSGESVVRQVPVRLRLGSQATARNGTRFGFRSAAKFRQSGRTNRLVCQ